MRKLSTLYSVSYTLYNKNNIKLINCNNNACFGDLFRHLTKEDINKNDYLILKNFLTKETKEYAYKYIKKLCLIFNFKYSFIKENEIKITNFNRSVDVRIFLTLYRILFENCHLEQINKNLNYIFIKSFVLNEYKIRDLVKRLIYCHNKSGLFLGFGHCIKSSQYQIKLKTKKNLLNYKPDNFNKVQGFFTKE